jgi:ribosome-associated protein YbcJ (S4-like RNA binding protein)
MLDKFLTDENVKVNGEIAGRRHILRTLRILVPWLVL